MIGGRAGALRDAGYRGRLDRKVLARCRRHDPIGQHATALAAKRRDEDGQGPYICFAELPSLSPPPLRGRVREGGWFFWRRGFTPLSPNAFASTNPTDDIRAYIAQRPVPPVRIADDVGAIK